MGLPDDRPGGLPWFEADGLGVEVGRLEGRAVGVGVDAAVGVAPGVALGVVVGWPVAPGVPGAEGEVGTRPAGTVVGTPGVGDPAGVATVPGPTVLPVPPVGAGRPTPVGVAVPDPTGVTEPVSPVLVDTGGPGQTPSKGDGPPPTTVRSETTERAPTTTAMDWRAPGHPRGRARAA